MKQTEEEYRVIGQPSERLVQEAVYAVAYDTDWDFTTDDVVDQLCALDSITEDEARRRIMAAVADGEVGVTLNDDFETEMWLDGVTLARIERRYNYWALHKKGSDVFHVHVKNENWHARCALRQWSYDNDDELPTWDDLVDAICDLLGTECNRSGGKHIALNALDAGAIYMVGHPTHTEDVRFAVAEDTDHEGLES